MSENPTTKTIERQAKKVEDLLKRLNKAAGRKSYQERTQEGNLAIKEEVRAAQDIAHDLPKIGRVQCRNRAIKSFRYFCEKYFPESFTLAWSPDHLQAIKKIETATTDGGLFAFAMPRGSGKTTLCERATLWATLTGRHPFVALVGADMGRATQMLKTLKIELECNDLLYRDFPAELHPFRRLEGEARRCSGQRFNGRRTHVNWTSTEVVFGQIPDSLASGSIIKVSALEASIRGMKHTLVGGESVRPTLVILDDPQTRESARSPSQCEARETIVAGDVLGMAGPGAKISALMPCTVIEQGDMADNILDREKHPDWQGDRTKMVYRFPDNGKLWEEYEELRAEGLRAGIGLREATKFYRRNRKKMDSGSEVAWPQRKNEGELSALQHAMNLMFRDRHAFLAEYQNEPAVRDFIEADLLTADQIAAKVSGLERRVASLAATTATAFIDVQKAAVFYLLVAWEDGFTGVVVDYGIYPEQNTPYFSLSGIRRTLQRAYPKDGIEAQIYQGLDALCLDLLRPIKREDGAELDIGVCMVDANWGTSTEVVRQFCRRSQHAARLLPAHGRYVGASSNPLGEMRRSKHRKAGERYGLNWQTSIIDRQRHLVYDTNYWKSFVQSRLGVSVGDPGCLSLFQARPADHRLVAEHLTAEYSVRTEAAGRTVDEWKQRPDRPDNHWLDCIVGATVAASYLGVKLKSQSPELRPVAVKSTHPPQVSESPRRHFVVPPRGDGRSFFVTAR